MPFLKPDEIAARWTAYREYLDSVKARLAPGALSYATSEWHIDQQSHKSPHDGWLESVLVQEPSTGVRKEQRSIEIVIDVLASVQDGKIRFTYSGVRSYAIGAPGEFAMPPLNVGHGDWLADEVRVSDRGLVLHEILFSRGATWMIEAVDLRYEWLSLMQH
jgi:hypothetical protein